MVSLHFLVEVVKDLYQKVFAFQLAAKLIINSSGCVACMADKKVTESYKVKRQVIVSGHEGAEMIMRVDDILKSAPRQRAPDRCM